MSLDAVPAGLAGHVPDLAGTDAARVPGRPETAADAVHAALFHGAALVRDRVSVEINGHRYAVSPVSAGFLALGVEAFPRARDVAAAALRMGRPVALIGELAGTALALAGVAGSTWIHSPEPSEAHFLLPARFVRDRAWLLRRRLSCAHTRPDGPPQRLTAVGVGPRPFSSPAELRALVGRAEAVVATDWTYLHTLPRLLGTPSPPPGPRHRSVPYDSADYDATIRQVSTALNELQDEGARDVALLVEGNPDTYDILDGVCLDRRRLDVRPGVPIALVAAGEAGAPAAPARIAYLSGLPHRHGQTRRQLRDELELYVRAGITCVLVEMTYGDLDLAVQVARRSPTPRTLVLLSDAYTPDARRLVTTSRSAAGTRTMLERARGTLSTLAIFDGPGGLTGRP